MRERREGVTEGGGPKGEKGRRKLKRERGGSEEINVAKGRDRLRGRE